MSVLVRIYYWDLRGGNKIDDEKCRLQERPLRDTGTYADGAQIGVGVTMQGVLEHGCKHDPCRTVC